METVKKYVILLIALIIIFFIYSFTAFFILSLENLEKDISCLNYNLPSEVDEGVPFQIYVNCENCGSTKKDFYVEITAYNDRRVIQRFLSTPYNLNPSQFIEVYASISLPSGTHNISIRCYTENYTREEIAQIHVRKKYFFESPIGAPISTIPEKYDVEIIYPEVLNVSSGDVIDFYIKVINKGNTLSEVTFNYSFADFLRLELIYPKKISKLFFNETAIFLFRLNASSNIEDNESFQDFCFISKEIQKCFKIKIVIKKLEEEKKIENLISYYENIIKELTKEIAYLESIEKDVELAKKYLENASYHLLAAKNLYRFKFYQDSIRELDATRSYIILTILEITKLNLEKLSVRVEKIYTSTPWYYILYFLFALILIFLIYYLAKKLREYFKYRDIYSLKLRRLRL
ncbi:MAG: hypothetical protein QW409_03025 [Candidatus Aenigmatarchaeota archaeon]